MTASTSGGKAKSIRASKPKTKATNKGTKREQKQIQEHQKWGNKNNKTQKDQSNAKQTINKHNRRK